MAVRDHIWWTCGRFPLQILKRLVTHGVQARVTTRVDIQSRVGQGKIACWQNNANGPEDFHPLLHDILE